MLMQFEVEAKPETVNGKLGMGAFYLAAGALVYTLDVGLPTDLGDPWIYAYLAAWPLVVLWHLMKVVLFAFLAIVCLFVFSAIDDRRGQAKLVRNARRQSAG